MSEIFERVNPIGEGLIRGPARVLVALSSVAFPKKLADIINLPLTSVSYAPEVQTLSMVGTPTGGTFTLAFGGVQTSPLPYTATSAAVQAALNLLDPVGEAGGVAVTGTAINSGSLVVTFGNDGIQTLIAAPSVGIALTGGTTPRVNVVETTKGIGQYDIVIGSGWVELGSTRGGVQVGRNNTEDQLDIDQIKAPILSVPNEWTMTGATQLAETTLENIALGWECGPITTDLTTAIPERHLNLSTPGAYVQRKMAVLHQKTIGPAAGLVRAAIFRQVLHAPQQSQLDYQKTGQMQTIPVSFGFYADNKGSFGEIIEQELFA